jgi:tetratricopeptide (TPR) repeat protein
MLALVLASSLCTAELLELGASPREVLQEPVGDTLLREARSLRYAQRWYEAAQKYRSFISLHPSSSRVADARFWLAATLEQDQRWDEAVVAYSEFLKYHPDQRILGREAKLNRIRCWGMRKGQAPDAIPGLVDAISDPIAEVQAAAALQLAQGKDPRAVPGLQKGLTLPAYADACSLALSSLGIKPVAAQTPTARFLVIRIKERNKPDAVTIRVAMALARVVESYLSEAQIQQARRKGVDLENLMDQAEKMPKGSPLFSVEDKDSSVSITVE